MIKKNNYKNKGKIIFYKLLSIKPMIAYKK